MNASQEDPENKSALSHSARVFSIAPGTPFLPGLVSALIEGRIIPDFVPASDITLLPEATIYVPNRRTARELSLAFVDAFPGQAGLLPAIRTLGDVQDDEFGLSGTLDEEATLLPVVPALERKLELAGLVQHWVESLSAETRRLYEDEDIYIPSSQADAVRLAEDLCSLLDQMTREEIDWDQIFAVIPETFAQWWNLTAEFLKIIIEFWPQLLEERGQTDSALRSARLLEQRIRHYQENGSKGPVIIAGSTGSVPVTQRFLEVVARLDQGAIVLPGLDFSMEEDHWQALLTRQQNHPVESHPQFGLCSLLSALKTTRDNVGQLANPGEALSNRSEIVSGALALPEFSSQWREKRQNISAPQMENALAGISLIEAGNERQEALAIAVALRETLATPHKTAALVTPDRNLARRVSIELERFGIQVDDTAGQPFASSACGQFVRHVLQYCFLSSSQTDLAVLLKSPFCLAGTSFGEAQKMARQIELKFLRGAITRPEPGHLSQWLMQSRKLTEDNTEEYDALIAHAQRIDQALAPLTGLLEQAQEIPLREFAAAFETCLTGISTDGDGTFTLAEANGHGELRAFLDEVKTSDQLNFAMAAADIPSVTEALFAPLAVRNTQATHPRLHIFGPLEIRLMDYDRIILAGLNEGTWPRATRNDPFLNRSLRLQIGMSSPERATGLSAHDFQQLMGKSEVMLSRATRVDRAPSIASRWVQRLCAFIGEKQALSIKKRGNRYIHLGELLERKGAVSMRAERPYPVPPVTARPNTLSVTDIETWIRDPYALYAKRILNLRALDPLERDADARLRGTLYHAVMEEYASLETMRLPDNERRAKLVALAHNHIAAEGLSGEAALLWALILEDVAEQFVEWENTYWETRAPLSIAKEIKGRMELADGAFELSARADRIDNCGDGSINIIDYKTGASPSLKQARTFAPQMALEGAIARIGGFENIPASERLNLIFLRLQGRENFKEQSVNDAKNPLDGLLANAIENLEKMINAFASPTQGYVSRRAPYKASAMNGDYDHLARVREWSFGAEEDGDG